MMNDKIELKATKLPGEISAICCVACDDISERPLMAAEGEAGKALAAARVKRREYGYDVTLACGTLCPNCSRLLRATAVRYIDESGFEVVCESCHAGIIRAERR